MSFGWVVRCDPAAGTIDITGGERHTEGELTAVCAGNTDPHDELAAWRQHRRASSPYGPAATAIWDASTRTLHLARDRTGRYPLFHTRDLNGVLLAANDLRVLLRDPAVTVETNAVVLAEWLLERPSFPHETLLTGISRVPAGHVLEIRPDGERLRRDWEPPKPGAHPANEASRLGEQMEAAVRRGLNGRAGVFLSGGIDSTAVACATAAVSRELGLPAPVALCADIEGSSELEMQKRVAEGLGMELVVEEFRPGAMELERSLEVVRGALWPVATPWVVVGEILRRRGAELGATTLLDGEGGDELLDAGVAAASRLLQRGRFRALADFARAERAFSGARLRDVARAGIGRGRSSSSPLPDWISGAEIRASLEERAAAIAELPEDDLLDPFGAAGRETTAQVALDEGHTELQPYLDPDVVALVSGLPEESLVRGGDPKSPARAYVRSQLPAIEGRWPMPAVVGDMLDDLLESLPAQIQLGEDLENAGLTPGENVANSIRWDMMSFAQWRITF